jgi:hypothetical protein
VGYLLQNELILRSEIVSRALKKHNISMAVIQFNYAEYPFSITIGSATSSIHLVGNTDRNQWEEIVKDAKRTPGASIIRLLLCVGRTTIIRVRKAILPDADGDRLDASAEFLDVLNRNYLMRVIMDDGSLIPVEYVPNAAK